MAIDIIFFILKAILYVFLATIIFTLIYIQLNRIQWHTEREEQEDEKSLDVSEVTLPQEAE